MKNLLKRWPWLVILLLCVLGWFAIDIFGNNQQAEPQGILKDVPQCQDTATFEGWVLLSYVAEVHAPQGLPGGYTAVIKTPHFIKQTLPISFKESDAEILGRLKSPWPDQFLIGQVLPDYSLTKKYCKERTKPVPKVPDSEAGEPK